MKRNVNFFTIGLVWGTPTFLFMTVLLIGGAIAGGFTGLLGHDTDSAARLSAYLIQSAQSTFPPLRQLLGSVISTALWLLLCLAAGWLTPPSFFIGTVLAARGFSFSFTVAVLVSQLGMRGLLLSFAATAAAALITIPCLLITAASAYLAVTDAPRGQRSGYFYALRRYRGALALCFALSLAAAALRAVLAPLLLRYL